VRPDDREIARLASADGNTNVPVRDPRDLRPIILSGRQWRELIKISVHHVDDRPHIASIGFRPNDLVITNGHVLLSVPMAPDPERNFVVTINDVWPWLKGLRQYREYSDEEGESWSSYKLTLCRTVTGDLALYTPTVGGTLLFEPAPPTARVADSSIDGIFKAIGDKPVTRDTLDPKYLNMLRRLHRAFGSRGNGVDCSQGDGMDATMFRFHSFCDGHEGHARFVVMRMRPHDENPSRRSL
jgi:hypothetical protein